MGSSGSGEVDCSVGSIVWVRRRNGSWWPGKILSTEELAASHLTSPRSGTPVKLLGREDASVDWYNLERSKRVKAFRCGDFDECIERAESSQGMPIRKREKYARREDAIIHALELEKEGLRKQGNLVPQPIKSRPSAPAKRMLAPSTASLDNNGKPGNSKSILALKRHDISSKDENIGNHLYSSKGKVGNLHSWEDDHSEVVPRMRGLQDFGLRIVPSKRKLMSSGASDGSHKSMADSSSEASSSDDFTKRRYIESNGPEQLDTLRAKRNSSEYLPVESNEALVCKEVPPRQDKRDSFCFGEGNFNQHPHSITEENRRELMKHAESDSSDSDSDSESDSDSSDTEMDINEDMAAFSGAVGRIGVEHSTLERHGALESMSDEEQDESSLSGDMSLPYHPVPVKVKETVNKWQLKGKRNTRHLTRRSLDMADGRNHDGYTRGTFYEDNRTPISQRSLSQSKGFQGNADCNDGFDEADVGEYHIQPTKFNNERYLCTSRAAYRNQSSFGHDMDGWGDLALEDRTAMKRYLEVKAAQSDSMFHGVRYFGRRRAILIDVDIEVKASYQKEPVPIVSVSSKLDGKSIIGHPIQIEAIADGSSEHLCTSDFIGNEISYGDGNRSVPTAWGTARRTSSRARRTHVLSALESYEAGEDRSYLDKGRKHSPKKLNVGGGGFNPQASILRKISHPPQTATTVKSRKKSGKKVSSNCQKIRTLSSIGVEQNHDTKPPHHISNSQINGLIKPEYSGPPTVACIPVKLVFSRLLEKINRPPSNAAASRVLLSNRGAGKDES